MSIRETVLELLSHEGLPAPVCQTTEIAPQKITYAASVREACKANYCGRYGKCWTCPPGVGDWKKLRDHYLTYTHALVYTTRHEIEDSFDFEGMEEARKAHDALDELVLKAIENDVPHELCGAGSCTICQKCTYPDAPCRFPEKARRSMEATGIDVVTLAHDTGINYINGVNTVTYFSIIFW